MSWRGAMSRIRSSRGRRLPPLPLPPEECVDEWGRAPQGPTAVTQPGVEFDEGAEALPGCVGPDPKPTAAVAASTGPPDSGRRTCAGVWLPSTERAVAGHLQTFINGCSRADQRFGLERRPRALDPILFADCGAMAYRPPRGQNLLKGPAHGQPTVTARELGELAPADVGQFGDVVSVAHDHFDRWRRSASPSVPNPQDHLCFTQGRAPPAGNAGGSASASSHGA